VLKFWARRGPLRPPPRRAEAGFRDLVQTWLSTVKKAETRRSVGLLGANQGAAAGGKEVGINPECAPKSTD
jgi:hypothetical protein